MPSRRPASRPTKKKSASGRILPATLLGLTAALMFVAVAAQYAYAPATVTAPLSGTDVPRPDVSTLLPPGAAVGPDSVVYIDDPLAPAFAVGYSESGRASVALVVWDRAASRYAATSDVELVVSGASFAAAPRLRTVQLSAGGERVVVANGSLGGDSAASAVLVRTGPDKIALAQRREEDGRVLPAVFATGIAALASETVDLQDLNSDGRIDLVVTENLNSRVLPRAYSWTGTMFEYDPQLSWVLSMSKSLFPEPKK